jgi:hypothetical protein
MGHDKRVGVGISTTQTPSANYNREVDKTAAFLVPSLLIHLIVS